MTVEEGEEKKEQEGGAGSKVEEGGREPWGEDCIVLRYNGLVVRILKGGLAEWKEVYAEALALRSVRCVVGDFDQGVGFTPPPLFLSSFVTLDFPLSL